MPFVRDISTKKSSLSMESDFYHSVDVIRVERGLNGIRVERGLNGIRHFDMKLKVQPR